MRQWMIAAGGVDEGALKLVEDAPVPDPGPGELRIRVHAASLNYRDHLVMHGNFYGVLDHDVVPLSDASGVVDALGEGVTQFKVGDRVASLYYENWPDGPFIGEDKIGPALGGPHQRGVLADYAILTESGAVAVPDSLSFVEAAALPCAGTTAWNALFGGTPLAAGQTVLVQGTGGLSMLALQMAKAVGAKVIATSSNNAKRRRAEALGADATLNYVEEPEWSARVLALTDGRGCEKIVDIGGDGTLGESMKAIAFEGEIAVTGFMAMADAAPSPVNALFKACTLRGIAMGSRRMSIEMMALFERSALRPVIDRVFAFEDAAAAFRYKGSPEMFGKIVISIV